MESFGIIALLVVGIIGFFQLNKGKENKVDVSEFLPSWRRILTEKVAFYNSLNEGDKILFEADILDFFGYVRITGIDVEIDDTDRLLVASSAIIPIFAFTDWKYYNISEVLLYPGSFNEKFETAGEERRILGMVGEGAMNGTMILSKPALLQGFDNTSDKNNTAIHEFVHLIDKTDGAIDGIPENLLGKKYVLPWVNLIAKEIEQINKGKSDINPYGATNQTEFFAVASEYFFERPELLKSKHPELYQLMEEAFQQNLASRKLTLQKNRIGRNDPCPCNKGAKFKNCCGAVHYS
ncbi:MAG: zinc-dependent peptidase [Bacteroidetes bacterium]|nr:zinc-dependent peptidase [Bacteroidota bacterium]